MHTNSEERWAYWRAKLQEYRKSGLSRREFCERNRIKKSRMDYWFRRIGKPGASQGLVELKLFSAPALSSAMEVMVAGKYRIVVSTGFDSQLLSEVVRALESLA